MIYFKHLAFRGGKKILFNSPLFALSVQYVTISVFYFISSEKIKVSSSKLFVSLPISTGNQEVNVNLVKILRHKKQTRSFPCLAAHLITVLSSNVQEYHFTPNRPVILQTIKHTILQGNNDF